MNAWYSWWSTIAPELPWPVRNPFHWDGFWKPSCMITGVCPDSRTMLNPACFGQVSVSTYLSTIFFLHSLFHISFLSLWNTYLIIALSCASTTTQAGHIWLVQKLNADNHIGVPLGTILFRNNSNDVECCSHGVSSCPARIRGQLAGIIVSVL